MDQTISSIFSKQHLRLTKPRQIVFQALKQVAHPLSITEIIRACPTVDATSVYRTIDLFSKLGITASVSHGWKQRYELAEPFQPHHHHIRCTACEKLIDIDWPDLEKQIEALSRKYAFTITGHSFELSGLCANCTKRQAA